MKVIKHCKVVQRGYGISILGDTQKLSGHNCGQLALKALLEQGLLDKMNPKGPFQPQPFCDSVSHKDI